MNTDYFLFDYKPEFNELPIPGNVNQEQKNDENSEIKSLITGSENKSSKSQNNSSAFKQRMSFLSFLIFSRRSKFPLVRSCLEVLDIHINTSQFLESSTISNGHFLSSFS